MDSSISPEVTSKLRYVIGRVPVTELTPEELVSILAVALRDFTRLAKYLPGSAPISDLYNRTGRYTPQYDEKVVVYPEEMDGRTKWTRLAEVSSGVYEEDLYPGTYSHRVELHPEAVNLMVTVKGRLALEASRFSIEPVDDGRTIRRAERCVITWCEEQQITELLAENPRLLIEILDKMRYITERDIEERKMRLRSAELLHQDISKLASRLKEVG